MSLHIHELTSFDDIKHCEAIEEQVWGLDPRALVPAAQMVAAVHAGGLLAMAFDNETPVAFLYGFPAYLPDAAVPHGHHSHMMAVLSAYRGRGLGKALKWFQRDWCLARGYSWVQWTYDPLQAKNARLNLEHLGVYVDTYRVNEYGIMGGTLNAHLPSDRLLAYWDLEAKNVKQLAAGKPLAAPQGTAVTVLKAQQGKPQKLIQKAEAEAVRLEIPSNLNELLSKDPDLALEWRLSVREVMRHYLASGYRITRFLDTAYILENNTIIDE